MEQVGQQVLRAAFLDSSVWEAGLAVGVELHPRVRLGASLAWSRLRLEGQRTLAGTSTDSETVVSSVDGDDGHVRASAGLLVALIGAARARLPSLRLGRLLSARLRLVRADDERSRRPSRRPSASAGRPLITAGFAWRAADRWSFVAQGDVIRYGEVVDALERNVGAEAAAGFSLPNAIEPRLGAEFSAPLWCGCGSVKLRGGLHYRSPGTLRYEGTDPIAARAFAPGSWRTVATSAPRSSRSTSATAFASTRLPGRLRRTRPVVRHRLEVLRAHAPVNVARAVPLLAVAWPWALLLATPRAAARSRPTPPRR